MGLAVGQCGGGVGVSADDPVVPEVGPQDLGQPRQVVLFITEEPAVVPVENAFMVWSAADDETADVPTSHAQAAGQAAPWLDDLLGGGQRKPPDRIVDQAERRHCLNQRCRAPAGPPDRPHQDDVRWIETSHL